MYDVTSPPAQHTGAPGDSQLTTCPAGHYCEDASKDAPIPCLAGWFQANTGQQSCEQCTAGYYCPFTGTITPIACPDQHRCELGSATPTLCSDGEYCSTDDTSSQETQTLCAEGYYCVKGARYDCYPGWHCIEGASVPNPEDGTTGQACRAGYYCPNDATYKDPQACLGSATQDANGSPLASGNLGQYQPYRGATSSAECIDCVEGQVCATDGLEDYVSPTCSVGGLVCGTDEPCDMGFYCPAGTPTMLRCPDGYYADETGLAACKACDEGKYCQMQTDSGCITPQDCPKGFYCERLTSAYGRTPCRLGTYGAAEQLTLSTDCTSCIE